MPIGYRANISWHSDRVNERWLHVVWPQIFCSVGFIISAVTLNTAPRYIATFMMMSIYGSFGCILSWVSSSLPRPSTKRAISYAVVNAGSNLASIYASYFYPSTQGPRYWQANVANVAFSGLCIIMATVLRFFLAWRNRRLEKASRILCYYVRSFVVGDRPRAEEIAVGPHRNSQMIARTQLTTLAKNLQSSTLRLITVDGKHWQVAMASHHSELLSSLIVQPKPRTDEFSAYPLSTQAVSPIDDRLGAHAGDNILDLQRRVFARIAHPLDEPVSFRLVHNLEDVVFAKATDSRAAAHFLPIFEDKGFVDFLNFGLGQDNGDEFGIPDLAVLDTEIYDS
ncbi:unnamed protein product [Fusarium equiseti]|uniref:Allantoate permease n=1 Tax=Fusarium equiseti TaxID=61235 RepID=A0A8J2IKP7_FUSEQ|nr:unnamed protein product [Fusarium equiseti]